MDIGSITAKGVKYEFKDTDARAKAADNATKIEEAKITLEDLSVTANGDYTADEKKGYKKVSVNVSTGVGTLYCWRADVAYEWACYTTTDTPSVGDFPIFGQGNGDAELSYLFKSDIGITSVGTNSFVHNGFTFNRTSEYDIDLTSF